MCGIINNKRRTQRKSDTCQAINLKHIVIFRNLAKNRTAHLLLSAETEIGYVHITAVISPKMYKRSSISSSHKYWKIHSH